MTARRGRSGPCHGGGGGDQGGGGRVGCSAASAGFLLECQRRWAPLRSPAGSISLFIPGAPPLMLSTSSRSTCRHHRHQVRLKCRRVSDTGKQRKTVDVDGGSSIGFHASALAR